MNLSPGRYFDEVKTGDRLTHAVTVTETHIVLSCGLFGDFNPLHSNQQLSEQGLFGGRIAHGPLTAGIMAGVLGNYFAGTALAFLEQRTRFLAPVHPGDTLTTQWEITGAEYKEKHRGGILTLKAACRNQGGQVVAEGEGKILVACRPT